MNRDENLICELLQKGDSKGMDLLFDVYYKQLVLWADTIVKDVNQAEDVVQNLFIHLWDKRKDLKLSSESLSSFLYVSVRNNCYKKIEKKDVFKNTISIDKVEVIFEEYNENHDLITTKIINEINNLPPRSREVMNEVFIHGLKYREVAEKFNISISTVKTLMGNSIKKLRESLDEDSLAVFFFFMKKNI